MYTNNSKKEGSATVAVENQTAKVPSMVYLIGGLGALTLSMCLMHGRRKHTALMIGQWAAPILIMGLYNKIVKTEGND